MSLSFQILFMLIDIAIVFLGFIVIGVPIVLIVLKLLDKYCEKVSLPRKKRILIAFLSNIGLCLLISGYKATEDLDLREDWALDIVLEEVDVSLPKKFIVGVEYPTYWNNGDDFGVDKTWKLLHPISPNDIEKLNQLCKTDERWTYSEGCYCYSDDRTNLGVIIKVNIDVTNRTIFTEYHKW